MSEYTNTSPPAPSRPPTMTADGLQRHYDFPPPAGTPVGEPEDPKKRRRWPWVAGAALLVVALAGVAGVWALGRGGDDEPTATESSVVSPDTTGPAPGGSAPDDSPDPTSGTASPDQTEPDPTPAPVSDDVSQNPDAGLTVSNDAPDNLHSNDFSVAAVAARVAPSVVTISADIESDLGSGGSVGTGVIVTEDGNILTNAHVVDGAVAVRVRLNGETEPVEAEVLAADPGNDLALVDISGEGYTPAVFAKPGATQLGDPVVAIGFALDLDGEPSVTLGIVSALNRTLDFDDNTALDGLIQTDAAISSGNSGGPLVNNIGEVIGINTAVARGDAFTAANNLGFAISIDEILQVVPELRDQANGIEREPGYLGVQLQVRTDGGQGALVGSVEPGTPAAEAGIQADDVVLSVDGVPINGSSGLVAAIRDREPGDEVHITLSRDGTELTVTAVLADQPDG